MSSEMPQEVVRVVAAWLAEWTDWNDDFNRDDQEAFDLTCRAAHEVLKPEIDWLVETDKQVINENLLSLEDFDAGTTRRVSVFWDYYGSAVVLTKAE